MAGAYSVHTWVFFLALCRVSSVSGSEVESCYDPQVVAGFSHIVFPCTPSTSEDETTDDAASFIQGSQPELIVDGLMAGSEPTVSFVLDGVKKNIFVDSIILGLLILLLGAYALIAWLLQRWSERPESEIPHENETHHNCHGFSTAFDWICPDSVQQFVGDPQECLEEQRLFRCRILTLAIFSAIAILILTLWSSNRTGSLVLRGDGVHLFSDVVTYSVLLFAEVASSSWRGDMGSYSFGYGRTEVLVSFLALSAQYFAMIQLLWSAVERLQDGTGLADNAAETIMLVGVLSVILNTGIGGWMHVNGISLGHDHHTQGGSAAACAKVHLLCDGAQNLMVLLTGIIIWWKPELAIIEPICAMLFVACFFYGTCGFFVQLVDILMERVPRSIDSKAVHYDLLKIKGVQDVHCLHIWSVASGKVSVAAHICTEDSDVNEDVLHQAQIVLQHRYGIKHSIFQVSDGDTSF